MKYIFNKLSVKTVIILCSILIVNALTINNLNAQQTKSETRSLLPFDKVSISKGVNVTLRSGAKPEAEIIILNSDLENVITEQEGSELTIKLKPRLNKNMAVNVFLTYQELRSINTSSGGSLNAENVIATDTLILKAGIESSVDLEIDVDYISAGISGAKVTLSGEVIDAYIITSSAAKFSASELTAENANIRAGSGSSVEITVTEQIIAEAGLSSTITYSGDPSKKEVKTTSGGKVVQIDE